LTLTRINRDSLLLTVFLAIAGFAIPAAAEEGRLLHSFDRLRLTDVYYSEGAAVGDLNRDGKLDLVYGPYWYEGPDFQKKHEIYEPKPQPTDFYADNFFTWVDDFNADGRMDFAVTTHVGGQTKPEPVEVVMSGCNP